MSVHWMLELSRRPTPRAALHYSLTPFRHFSVHSSKRAQTPPPRQRAVVTVVTVVKKSAFRSNFPGDNAVSAVPFGESQRDSGTQPGVVPLSGKLHRVAGKKIPTPTGLCHPRTGSAGQNVFSPQRWARTSVFARRLWRGNPLRAPFCWR